MRCQICNSKKIKQLGGMLYCQGCYTKNIEETENKAKRIFGV